MVGANGAKGMLVQFETNGIVLRKFNIYTHIYSYVGGTNAAGVNLQNENDRVQDATHHPRKNRGKGCHW